MNSFLRAPLARSLILSLCLLSLAACDDGEEDKRKAEAQRQLQAQLQMEQAQRRRAEQAVIAAEESRSTWIYGISGGACAACVLVGLLGVYIGSRPLKRSGKEGQDG